MNIFSVERFKDTHTPIGVVSPSHELLQRTTTKEDAKDKELIAEVKGKDYCKGKITGGMIN
jgi:hypothetical protein